MKKIVALWGVLLMFVSIFPAAVVQADEMSAVDQAKGCIDGILNVAPTPERYVFTETLADHVDTLGKLLQGMTNTADVGALDAYVTEKTTVEETSTDPSSSGTPVTTSRFRTVQQFYQAYADVQNVKLAELAKPIDKAITDVLSRPLVRADYVSAKEKYDVATKHIKAAVDAENVNAINHIRELLELADTADKKFSQIQNLNSGSKDTDYAFFTKDVESAKTAYGLYESKFAELRRYAKYATCLVKSMKNTLFTHYDLYQKALLVAAVERAYDDLGVYEVLNGVAKEKLDVLQAAVDAGSQSDFKLSVYDYYRGEAIQLALVQYGHIKNFEEMMSMTSETPVNKLELTSALRAYRFYCDDLTNAEKSLVPPELVKKMNNAVLLNTDCEDVTKLIGQIGAASSEEEYNAFVQRYEEAYKAYRLFVNKYSGFSDIPELITNVAALDEATDVLELIRSIRQIEDTEDALMCSKRLQIEGLLTAYDRMETSVKNKVFNITVLQGIYEDVKTVSDLRARIDTFRVGNGGFTLLDEQYVKGFRSDYEKLNERAKRYFGQNYQNQLISMEKELDVQNLNAALRVSTMINQIGTVNVKAKERIHNAREAYNGLTEAQKAYVSNLSSLEAAEEAYGKLDLSVAKAVVSSLGSYSYAGTALTPSVTVQLNGVKLLQDIDYTLSYSSNTNVGTGKVVIRGIGCYTGSLTKTFTIRPLSMSGAAVNGCKAKYAYTGKAVLPVVQVVLNGRVLTKGIHYTVTYKNNTKRGVANIVIKGIGNYTGTATTSFSIVRNSIKNAKVSGVKLSYLRTGKAIRPKVKVKLSGATLKKKRDYLVSYQKNKKKGTATVVIKGTGNYSGTKKVKFKII